MIISGRVADSHSSELEACMLVLYNLLLHGKINGYESNLKKIVCHIKYYVCAVHGCSDYRGFTILVYHLAKYCNHIIFGNNHKITQCYYFYCCALRDFNTNTKFLTYCVRINFYLKKNTQQETCILT